MWVVVVLDQGSMLCGVPPASQLAAPNRQAHVQCSSCMYRKKVYRNSFKVIGQWATVKQKIIMMLSWCVSGNRIKLGWENNSDVIMDIRLIVNAYKIYYTV